MSTIGYYICVPFAWVLRTFYELTGSYGWALVLFTIVVKLITLPFQMKSKKSMMRMNLFQPKIKEIQTKYANNPQKMNDEIQMLYAKEGVNPMSGCLWSFLPFPILIALYSIIRQPLSRFMMISKDVVTEITTLATTLGYNAELVRKGYEEIGLAKFISDNFADFSGKFDGLLNVNYNFLGLDLTVMPGDVWKDFFTGGWPVIGVVLIPFISGALSFLQSKVSMSGNVAAEGNDAAARSNRMMMWMMPLMSLWIGFTLPAALGVYWIVNSLLYAIQEKVLTKYYKSHMEDELSEKEKQKRDDRLRRMEAAREQQKEHDAADRHGDVRLVVDAIARLHLDILALCDRRLEVPGQALAVTRDTVCVLCLRFDGQVQREPVLDLVEHALHHRLALGILFAHIHFLPLDEEVKGIGVVEPRFRHYGASIAAFHRREHIAALGRERLDVRIGDLNLVACHIAVLDFLDDGIGILLDEFILRALQCLRGKHIADHARHHRAGAILFDGHALICLDTACCCHRERDEQQDQEHPLHIAHFPFSPLSF